MGDFIRHSYRYMTFFTLAFLPAFLLSCKLDRASQRHVDTAQAEQFVSVTDTCTLMPADSTADAYRNLKNTEVYTYYQARGFATNWIERPTPGVDAMIHVIRSARFYGLFPSEYHLGEIEAIRDVTNCESRQRLDALLTDALFTLSSHIGNGRLKPIAIDSMLLKDEIRLISRADIETYLASREPRHEGYQRLRSSLASIYDTLNSTDKNLLLAGITSDSIPAQSLIKKIEINLERWRWEEDPLGEDHVWVNIPAFEVVVLENNNEILRSKAIVGSPRNRTPIFSSAIECFTVYPYWHVPRSIAVGQYLPAIQKDLSFIPLNNLDVLDRNGRILRYDTLPWNTYSQNHFPVFLRQREGTDNALGVVKFQFDNPYSVLLHDTNAKRLFQYEDRARSHGCIRMEKAIEFAYYLAENYTKYSADQISRYLETKTMRRIDLNRPLPIHMRYFTAVCDGDLLKQYDDIYGHDKKLMSRFYQTVPVIAEKRVVE